MKPCEMSIWCHRCTRMADYCESVPDSSAPGVNPGECGYKWVPLCWLCAVERREVATSRVSEALICEKDEVLRLDRGRCSGLCVCEDCGKAYYDHPPVPEYPFLQLLCDGSVVKL